MNSAKAPQGLAILQEKQAPEAKTDIKLQNLIPIAMVIVGGCESCAEKMVERALLEGSTFQEIDKTLRIVAGMQKLGCFAGAVGPEVTARMEKPLEAGRRALEKAMDLLPNDGAKQAAKCS